MTEEIPRQGPNLRQVPRCIYMQRTVDLGRTYLLGLLQLANDQL